MLFFLVLTGGFNLEAQAMGKGFRNAITTVSRSIKRSVTTRPAPRPQTIQPIIEATQIALKDLRQNTKSWAKTCPDGTISPGDCPYGDMTLFSSLSCFAGQNQNCEGVRRSQGPNGRWWRNPTAVDIETPNSFSRDQTLGLYAYFVRTTDSNLPQAQQEAIRWLAWVKDHGNKTCIESNGRCWLFPEFYPQHWGLMGHVWQALQLDRNLAMKAGALVEDEILLTEARTAPDGFPTHLVGVALLIRQELARKNVKKFGSTLRNAAATLVGRQPQNPFYLYLRDGPSEPAAQIVLQKCPTQGPEGLRDWAWQRNEREQSWRRASGWDCIFMVDLLVGPG